MLHTPTEASPKRRVTPAFSGVRWGAVHLLVLVFLFVQFAVLALVFSRGGRYERYFAVLAFSTGVLFQLVQTGFDGHTRAVLIVGLDCVAQVGLLWLLHRHRAAWTWWMTIQNLSAVALDAAWFFGYEPKVDRGVLQWSIWWLNSVLAYLQLAIMAATVLRRDFGPPYRIPARLAAEAAQAKAAASGPRPAAKARA